MSNVITGHSRCPNPKEPHAAWTSVNHSNKATHWFFQNSRISTHWTHRSRIRENPEGPIPNAERKPHSSSQFEEHDTSDASKAQATLGHGITGKSDHKQSARSKKERCSFCANLKSRLLKPPRCTQQRRYSSRFRPQFIIQTNSPLLNDNLHYVK